MKHPAFDEEPEPRLGVLFNEETSRRLQVIADDRGTTITQLLAAAIDTMYEVVMDEENF